MEHGGRPLTSHLRAWIVRRCFQACPGANVTVHGLKVCNKGWRWVPCGDDAGEVDKLRGFVVERDETKELVFDKPGVYTVP